MTIVKINLRANKKAKFQIVSQSPPPSSGTLWRANATYNILAYKMLSPNSEFT